MASSIGRCSKHRKNTEFAIGDTVRLVCANGRTWCCFPPKSHLDGTGRVIGFDGAGRDAEYTNAKHRSGGLVSVRFDGNDHQHYCVPRALEKI